MKLFPRLTAFTVATLIAISPLTTLAGEGHDHGEAPTASTGPALPRFAATSSTFELIGVLNGHDLTLWLERLGRYVGELHLHDNEGSTDDHLPVGKGNFPFDRLFAFLRGKGISPIVTVEPHTEQNLWDTLAYIRETNLLDHPGGNL